jgi:hypothetical protein
LRYYLKRYIIPARDDGYTLFRQSWTLQLNTSPLSSRNYQREAQGTGFKEDIQCGDAAATLDYTDILEGK